MLTDAKLQYELNAAGFPDASIGFRPTVSVIKPQATGVPESSIALVSSAGGETATEEHKQKDAGQNSTSPVALSVGGVARSVQSVTTLCMMVGAAMVGGVFRRP